MKKSASDEQVFSFDGISPQIAAFHGQQAIEKLLKAWLFALGEDPPKTHSLRRLMGLLEMRGQSLPVSAIPYEDFNDYAVQWRYQDVPEWDGWTWSRCAGRWLSFGSMLWLKSR